MPQRRYEKCTFPVEYLEDYKPGGLCPIDVGQSLDGDRYQIIAKLGYGAFSTVWLARDIQ